MPLYMIRGDIAQIPCDAAVSTGACAAGTVNITESSGYSARRVIQTAEPEQLCCTAEDAEVLSAWYRSILLLAAENRLESVALPLISAGKNGYPRKNVQEIAVREIARFLENQDMTVYLVQNTLPEGQRFYPEIGRWISSHSDVQHCAVAFCGAAAAPAAAPVHHEPAAYAEVKAGKNRLFGKKKNFAEAAPAPECCEEALRTEAFPSLAERIRQQDESFSQMLLRKIDESGMTDAECYKKANIDRKLFSKIRSDPHYQPRKVTAIAFAIALELTLDETNVMLRAAGYAFSHSNTFDLIVEYFIRKGIYNVFTINEVLYEYDQLLIGA